MANAPWMDRWKRSPRQDRRVVENGVFVELGKVHLPEPPVEEVPEQEQSALELVTEVPKVPEREQISGTEAEEGRYAIEENRDGATSIVDDGARGESGVQGTADPVEGNAGANGQAPEAEGTPATEGSESDGRVPASDSVAAEGGQSLSEKMQDELEPLDAVKAHQEGSQTIAEIADAVAPGRNVSKSPVLAAPYDLSTSVQDLPDAWKFLSPDEAPADSVIVGRLHDETLTEEQSDALAETLRLPDEPGEFTPNADEIIAAEAAATVIELPSDAPAFPDDDIPL